MLIETLRRSLRRAVRVTQQAWTALLAISPGSVRDALRRAVRVTQETWADSFGYRPLYRRGWDLARQGVSVWVLFLIGLPTLQVIAVANLNPDVALALAAASDPAQVVLGLAVSGWWMAVAVALFLTFDYFIRDPARRGVTWYAFSFTGWLLLLLVGPWRIVVTWSGLLLAFVALRVVKRQVDLRVRQTWFARLAIVYVGAPVLATGTLVLFVATFQTPWLPAEDVWFDGASSPATTVYVLSEGTEQVLLLTERGRRVERVAAATFAEAPRRFCVPRYRASSGALTVSDSDRVTLDIRDANALPFCADEVRAAKVSTFIADGLERAIDWTQGDR